MIKNLVFDVGGIILDDSKENIDKLLKRDSKNIYRKAYGGNFRKCLLGEISMEQHRNSFKNTFYFKSINYLLDKKNLPIVCPLLKDNLEYIKSLKEKGYHLYLLTNMTKETYEYLNDTIKINRIFDGGIYSYQEHLKKPDERIYELLINRFHLKKEETIFFDDKINNVLVSEKCGIKGICFHSIQDIQNNIN